MKTITKIKNNLGKVAGSALLVGATVAGGAAMVSAQDNGSSGSLGDFPAPFVSDDGEVDTSVVVGETAEDGQPVSTLDVVSGVEIAGTLGNAAFTETEETVSVDAGVAGWSAENGLTLNRANNNLFLSDFSNSGESRLDDRDVEILDSTTFTSEDNEDVDVDFEVEIQENAQRFDASSGDLDDPELYVEMDNRGSVTTTPGESLFHASAEFSETMDFVAAGADGNLDGNLDGNADEMVEDGEEITLFGRAYTFSDESDTSELVLYGDSESFTAEYRDEYTFTAGGNEHTVETRFVSDSETATIRLDGSTREVEEGDTIRVSGQDVRVRDIYPTGPDGEGDIVFAIGSEELSIQSNRVEIDGDRVRGVAVSIDQDDDANDFRAVDEITLAFGGQETDEDLVQAGEYYEDTVFGQLQFHYGGLNADASENYAESFEVEADDDDEATFTTTSDSGEREEIQFADETGALGHDDGNFALFEGQPMAEDDRTVLNENDRAGAYEVTTLVVEDFDNAEQDGIVELEIENLHTGQTIEIEDEEFELSEGDDSSDGVYTLENERIDGMRFDVSFHDEDFDDAFDSDKVTFERNGAYDTTTTFTNFYTETDAGAAFSAPVDLVDHAEFGPGGLNVELPSALDSTVEVNLDDVVDEIEDEATTDDSVDAYFTPEGSELEFVLLDTSQEVVAVEEDEDSLDDTDAEYLAFSTQESDGAVTNPAAVYVHPEDDDDNEQAFVVEVDSANNAGDVDVHSTPTEAWDYSPVSLDSDDDLSVAYNLFGTYTEYDDGDSDNEHFRAQVPGAQSTSGMAFTGPDGSLSAQGGATDGTVTSMSPTYNYADGVLDSDGNIGQVQNSDNLVLVGGPSVNALVAELADEGETWTADEYTEGEGLIQHVPDAFSEGQDAVIVAGYSGEDTRAAGEFLADYRNNEGALEGETQVTISTESGQVVN